MENELKKGKYKRKVKSNMVAKNVRTMRRKVERSCHQIALSTNSGIFEIIFSGVEYQNLFLTPRQKILKNKH